MDTYTLTGATDWPMLVATMKLAAWIIGGMLGLIAALLAAMWWDFRQQFANHQDGEAIRCRDARKACQDENKREHDALWDAIEVCCPREAAKTKAQLQRKQELVNAQ